MKTSEFVKSQQNALALVGREVYAGRLPKLKQWVVMCSDCKTERANHYEHRDYGHPLDVRPVCQSCNIKSGSADNTPIIKEVPSALVCTKCSHQWLPRKENPAACPSCKTRFDSHKWQAIPATSKTL